jgi:hypothetical protein
MACVRGRNMQSWHRRLIDDMAESMAYTEVASIVLEGSSADYCDSSDSRRRFLCSIKRANDMAMENYSRYQQSVIRNYYKNQDNVSLQRAQELLTDLYLCEGKKKEKAWDSLFNHLERLGVPADQITHLKEAKNPELVAQLIQKKV